MDRRSFLTLLGAASLSVVVPSIWTPSTELLSATSLPTALPSALPAVEEIKKMFRVSVPADTIFDIILCGKNHCSEVATFDVVRPDNEKVLALALNTFGGILRWVAAPGEELRAPLQFVYSGNMSINVVGKLNDQTSFTVIEPEDPHSVLIPMSPTWSRQPSLQAPFDRQVVPAVFQSAWRGQA